MKLFAHRHIWKPLFSIVLIVSMIAIFPCLYTTYSKIDVTHIFESEIEENMVGRQGFKQKLLSLKLQTATEKYNALSKNETLTNMSTFKLCLNKKNNYSYMHILIKPKPCSSYVDLVWLIKSSVYQNGLRKIIRQFWGRDVFHEKGRFVSKKM